MTTTPLGEADPPQHHGDWKPAFDQVQAENEVLAKQVRSYSQLMEFARDMRMNLDADDVAGRAWDEALAALATGAIDV